MKTVRSVSILALVALTGLAAACGGGDGGDVSVEKAWARTSPMSATTGAAYMDLTASDDDRLVSASVDPSIAATVEIHEVVPIDGAASGDMESGDMESGDMESGDMESEDTGSMAMMMQELPDGLVLPAGETISLAPGGYHVMLLDLPAPLEDGQTFDLELNFESGTQTVSVEVGDGAP